MPRHRADIPTLSALLGGALLAALALRGLPWSAGLAPPPTPFTRASTPFLAPAYALLVAAAPAVPPGASAVVLAEPRDARLESHLFRVGLALLPGRDVRPAAVLDTFTPSAQWDGAEYRIVVGRLPSTEQGTLVLSTPEGTVWRIRSPR